MGKNGMISEVDFSNDKKYIPHNVQKMMIDVPFNKKPVEVSVVEPDDIAYQYALASIDLQTGRGGKYFDKSPESKKFVISELIKNHKQLRERVAEHIERDRKWVDYIESLPKYKVFIIREILNVEI